MLSKSDFERLFDVAETRREYTKAAHLMVKKALQALGYADPSILSEKEAIEVLKTCARGEQTTLRMAETIPLTRLFPPDEANQLVDDNREMAERWRLLEQKIAKHLDAC